MEIQTYRTLIARIANERQGEIVFNGSADHAAVIVENLFAIAQSDVRILTGDLAAKVYGEPRVVDRARQFLGHTGHKLCILVEDLTATPNHPLIDGLSGEAGFELRHLKSGWSEKIPFHFSTADADCYRFEKEKNSQSAIAAFGDKDTAAHLNSIFDSLILESQKVDMAELPAS